MAPKKARDKKELEKNTSREIIKAIKNSNDKCKKEIIDYLKLNQITEYTDDDLKIVMANQKKIDEKEMEGSALGGNYKFVIRSILFMLLLFSLVCIIYSCVNFYCNIYVTEIDKETALKIGFVIIEKTGCVFILATLVVFIDWLILAFLKDKINNYLYTVLMTAPLIYFIIGGLIAHINEFENIFSYFLMSYLFSALSFIFIILYKETKTLNKADAYNIMILLFTIISLALSVYSIIG